MAGSTSTGEAMVVAALPEELRPLVRRLAEPRIESSGEVRAYLGRLGGQRIVSAVIGDGARRAAHALEELLVTYRPRCVLLIGVAGALSPDLQRGAVVRVGSVVDSARLPSSGVGSLTTGGRPIAVSVSRIVATAAEKANLWERLGRPPRCVVDLESAAFVESVRSAGASWDVIRAVSDGASDDLPPEIVAAADRDGHVDRIRVATAIVPRPWRWASLLKLRRRVLGCADALSTAAVDWLDEERGQGRETSSGGEPDGRGGTAPESSLL